MQSTLGNTNQVEVKHPRRRRPKMTNRASKRGSKFLINLKMIFVWKASILPQKNQGKEKGLCLCPMLMSLWFTFDPAGRLGKSYNQRRREALECCDGTITIGTIGTNSNTRDLLPPDLQGEYELIDERHNEAPVYQKLDDDEAELVIDVWLLLMFEIVEFYQRRHRSGFFTFVPKYPFKMPITCYKQRC